MTPINTLIVEDELLIAETLKLYLEERGHHVLDIAISYEEAIGMLGYLTPDIVLLDIRLYGHKSGLDLADYLQSHPARIPYIIVSSQFDTRTVREATTLGAAGYITKPIAKETLWSTVELAVLRAATPAAATRYIDLKTGHDIQRVALQDILYLKSDHVYVEVHGTEQTYLCRSTLHDLLDRIDQPHFVRCHRSYIVNTRKIERFSTGKVWINGVAIPVSERYRKALQ